jgi:hypothetical protein
MLCPKRRQEERRIQGRSGEVGTIAGLARIEGGKKIQPLKDRKNAAEMSVVQGRIAEENPGNHKNEAFITLYVHFLVNAMIKFRRSHKRPSVMLSLSLFAWENAHAGTIMMYNSF